MARWGDPCMAITARGKPCGRPHRCEQPVTFAWDPAMGVGIGAPPVKLCGVHNYVWDLAPEDRVEIAGGWYGRVWNHEAGVWTVLCAVFEDRTGENLAPEWWARRANLAFGVRAPWE